MWLGTTTTVHNKSDTEVSVRVALAYKDACCILSILRNPRIKTAVRVNIVQSHIFSKALFQSCAWSDLSLPSYNRIAKLIFFVIIISMARIFIRFQNKMNSGLTINRC